MLLKSAYHLVRETSPLWSHIFSPVGNSICSFPWSEISHAQPEIISESCLKEISFPKTMERFL